MGILVVAFIFCIIMAIASVHKGKAKQNQNQNEFEQSGFNTTKKIRDLVVDEPNQKWMLCSSKNPIIHDFSEISSVEITENGQKYKSQHGVMRAATGGIVFGTVGALVGAGTASKAQTISHLSVDIYLKSISNPLETALFITSPVKTDSLIYKKAYETVQQMVATLTAMKNIAEQ